eukprot:130707-Rhodomonas_salina.2
MRCAVLCCAVLSAVETTLQGSCSVLSSLSTSFSTALQAYLDCTAGSRHTSCITSHTQHRGNVLRRLLPDAISFSRTSICRIHPKQWVAEGIEQNFPA